jgi:hypothetical protein
LQNARWWISDHTNRLTALALAWFYTDDVLTLPGADSLRSIFFEHERPLSPSREH